jgi:hypothetical protein
MVQTAHPVTEPYSLTHPWPLWVFFSTICFLHLLPPRLHTHEGLRAFSSQNFSHSQPQSHFIPTRLWRWNRQWSETFEFELQTPRKNPEENIPSSKCLSEWWLPRVVLKFCFNYVQENKVKPRFTNLIRSWRPFVTRSVRKRKLLRSHGVIFNNIFKKHETQ